MPSNDYKHASENHHEPLSPFSCVLLLNGFPGVGKLTIAKALEAKLKLDNTPYRLIDNHLLIDPAVAIEPVRNTDHYALRKLFRKAAFEGLKALKEERLVIIFTAALATSHFQTPNNDMDQFSEYVDVAEARDVPLVVVNIACDLGTNRGRLCSKERREVGGKMKLVDIDILERLRQETLVLDREQAMACRKEGSIFHFELDTSELAVEQATQEVWGRLCTVATSRQASRPECEA